MADQGAEWTRIAIVGNSGSGKSTLARRLGEQAGIDPIDLDEVYWEPEAPGVARPLAVSAEELRERLGGSRSWIVEGCYDDLIAEILDFEPELIFLDPPEETCVAHCRSRPWEPHKYPTEEAQNAMLPQLLEWVASYYTRSGPMSHEAHVALYERYQGPKRRVVDAGLAP